MQTSADSLTPAVSRVAIAWVCVATNDGHPLHLDHVFAKAAGFKDVVVPGHLLIGWMGQYLEEWCGDQRKVSSWKIRFSAPVWPDDRFTLTGALAPEAAPAGMTKVTVTATSQEGKVCAIVTADVTTP